jgi:DNA modification methylase
MGRLQSLERISQTMAVRRSASVRRFNEIDWDFPDQFSESAFSDLHWHPCRFPSQVPALVIGRLTTIGDAILDPFMGSGTALVEAQRLGRKSVGIDINPIACLMTRAKTLPFAAVEISEFIASVKNTLFAKWEQLERLTAPTTVQKDKWYTRKTIAGLERLWGYVNSQATKFEILLQASFSAVLLPACRETRHWGYICDNSQPKSDRERDVRELFCEILDNWIRAYEWREAQGVGKLGQCKVIEGNATSALRTFHDRSFSCFVTSPPYFGVTDYVKSQRLSMEWFEHDIEPARRIEIGARSKRHRQKAAEDYVHELIDVFTQVHRVLKRGGWGVLIFGQSPTRASAKAEFIEKLETIGFSLELEKVRQIREMRRQFPSVQREYVLLMRKI